MRLPCFVFRVLCFMFYVVAVVGFRDCCCWCRCCCIVRCWHCSNRLDSAAARKAKCAELVSRRTLWQHAANTLRIHASIPTHKHTHTYVTVCVLCAVGLSPGPSTLDRAGTLAHAQTIYKATTNVWRCKLSVNLCSNVCQAQGQPGVLRCDATPKDFKCCSHCSCCCCCCRLHIARRTLHVCCMFPSACQPLYTHIHTHRRTGEDMQAYIKLNEAWSVAVSHAALCILLKRVRSQLWKLKGLGCKPV